MHTTSRLGLDVPDTTDNESAYPGDAAQSLGVLDNALIYETGTLASRGTPGYGGQVYKTTDSGAETFTLFDGSLWLPLGLVPATTSSSASVVSGQALIVTGASPVTITLPSHANGQIVAVLNYSTGGTTVSGSSIQGAGLSSASSFPLGTVGAGAVLLDDGTSWRFLAGQQDSGWQALSLSSNWTTGSGAGVYTAAVRVLGNTAWLCGGLKNGTGGSTSASPASLPSTAYAPGASLVVVNASTNNSGVTVVPIALNSGVTALTPSVNVPNATIVLLDGLNYRLS